MSVVMRLGLLLLFCGAITFCVVCEEVPANKGYQLSGFKRYESVPVQFPKDICIFRVNQIKFAAALHYRNDGQLEFLLFKSKNGSYRQVFDRLTPLAVDMDCITFGTRGFIALAYNLSEAVTDVTIGAPIFEVTRQEISTVQFLATQYQSRVYLRSHNLKLYLVQTHHYPNLSDPGHCPFFEWSGYHFNYMGRIPCENARHIEAFTADDAAYVMVANYANFEGAQQATTFLYKYRHDQKKFVEHQKFGTQEAADVRYFYIENKEKLKDHFVVVANAMRAEGQSQFKDLGSQSVIYKYKNGVFVPLQQLNFHNVTAFLPIHNEVDKFVLLVACKNQDMKFLRYDGQQFDISRVQLTTGAFAKGVTSLRSFKESNETYIVVANERMMVNETNVYLPFYKIKENRTDLKREMMEQFKKLYDKLTNGTFASRINRVESVVKNFGQGIGVFNNANISAVESEVVINPKSNLTKRFWRKLAAATEGIQKLEEQFAELSGNKSANTTESDCTFESLQLDTLTVTDVLKISTINNKSIDHFALDRIIADKVIVKGKFQILNNTDEADPTMESLDSESLNRTTRQSDFSEIRVKNIIVTGTINGWNLTEFRNSILKKTGNQIITAPFNFTQLDVGDLQINGSINGERPSKVVMVNEGNFVVDQDLIFAEGAEVNHLVVNNRLSHIYVVDGQLQALYKNHSEVQIIRGWKKFENVNLLEPFELKGKIHSAQLDKMNPVVVISEDLNLEGDYEITGSVLITKHISATNFHGVSSQRNVLEILENGLSVKTPAIYQRMNFQAPIKMKNFNATFVNNIDTGDFITNDGNEEVIITGTKVFRNDLRISRGPCDVQNVNRININDLYENRLRKHGNQTITGQFTFKSVHTAGIKSASKILLNGTDINDILTKSTPQTLAEVNIQHLQTRTINISSMTTSKSKVFNHSLDYMIKDTVLPGTSAEILGHKTFKGNFTINNLFVKKRINHQSVKKLKESLKEILSESDISIDGDVIIEDDLQIEQIVFDGKINGIPAEKFGSCWLLNEGDQEFTAPQELSHLIAENMHVAKRINNHSIANIIKQLYWLDQEEFLPNVTFAKVIAEDEFITKGRINGLKFAEDVLLKETSETQIIEAPVFCEGDLIVTGEIRDLKVLNNIDLVKLQAVLKGETKNAKLTIDSANFENYPKFRLLNGYDLKEVYNNVWLANEDTVIEGHMVFNDVELKAHADLNGPMNGVDLDFLQQHYFSLTKAQRVSTPMTFKGPVEFMESLSGEEMNLTGVLVDNISKRTINISDFALNTLREDIYQEITGEWKIFNAIVEGDLNNVRINGLNFVDDVLRYDVTTTQKITAPKNFTNLIIADLECAEHATINKIDILDWLRNSAFIYGNYTIQGTTTIDDITVYEDVTVFGTVNGVKFDEKHLLLVDTNQTIHGNVVMGAEFEKTHQIKPLSIEHMDVETINGVNVKDFFRDLVPFKNELKIKGGLTFENTPIVRKFHSDRGLLNLENSTYSALNSVKRLIEDHKHFVESFKEKKAFLSHHKFKPKMSGKIHKVLHLKVQTGLGRTEERIAALRGDKEAYITFHRWDEKEGFFDLENELFSWLAKNSTIVDFDKVSVQGADILVIETVNEKAYNKHFITSMKQDLQLIFQLTANQSEKVIPVEYKEQQCFLLHAYFHRNLVLHCMKLSPEGNIEPLKELVIYTEDVVLQVHTLNGSQFIVATASRVDIWDLDFQMSPVLVIPVSNPVSISSASFDEDDYLAIAAAGGSVELYRSSNGSMYTFIQSIEAKHIIDAKFSVIATSRDLLLYVLTADLRNPFSGYIYRGILNFQKYLTPINFKPAKRFDLISMQEHGKYFISYQIEEEVQFLEVVVPRA